MSLIIPSHNKIALIVLLLTSLLSTVAYANTGKTAYVELTPDFVVNHLDDNGQLKYIKASITIRTDEAERVIILRNMPLIRDALVMFLSSRTSDQITGALAREETRKEATVKVNDALKEETGQAPVADILFGSFVTQ